MNIFRKRIIFHKAFPQLNSLNCTICYEVYSLHSLDSVYLNCILLLAIKLWNVSPISLWIRYSQLCSSSWGVHARSLRLLCENSRLLPTDEIYLYKQSDPCKICYYRLLGRLGLSCCSMQPFSSRVSKEKFLKCGNFSKWRQSSSDPARSVFLRGGGNDYSFI